MKEKDIQRINELYNLDKSIGLTPEQKEEQRKLRHEYIQSVRANLRAQLNNVSIKNEDGSLAVLIYAVDKHVQHDDPHKMLSTNSISR